MTRVDLHPDELLDPARLRSLTRDERARLDRHLAACPACAFETAASADFARWLDRGAPVDDPAATRLTERTMLALEERSLDAVRPLAVARARARWGRRLLIAAAILALTGGAGAAAWYLAVAPLLVSPPPAAPSAPRPADAGSAASRIPQRPSAPLPAPATNVRPEPTVAPPPVPPPSVPPAVPARESPRAQLPVVLPHAPAQPLSSHVAEPPATAAPVEAQLTAAELLERANEVRRAGDYATAAGLYRELQRTYPGTREDLVSRITLGRVLLDRLGDAAGALEQFDGYLAAAPDGTLAEDALVGRALALQRLGRADDERAAWTTLLSRFPESASAERARTRLTEPAGSVP